MLSDGEVEAFHESRVDLPATGCQHLLHGLKRSEDHPVTDAYQAPVPRRFDDLRIEQLGPGPPARLGPRAFGLAALWLHPGAKMAQQRCPIFLQPVGQEQRDATGRKYLHDLMDNALGHVTVQVVQTGITPQLVTSDRLQEAKTELLHPVKRLHTQWSGTPRRSAAVASTWPRPSSCFRQSASPPRSACQSSPYARAHRDGSTSQPYYSSVPRLRPARTSTTPHAASGCPDTSPRLWAPHSGCPLPITARPRGAAGSCRTEMSSVA